MTPCSGRRCAMSIVAGRAGLDRRAAGALPGGAGLHLLEIFPERLCPRRWIAHRSPAAEPVPCRAPGRRRRGPRGAGPGTLERSRAGLDRACRCKGRITAAGAAPEQCFKKLTHAPGRSSRSSAIRAATQRSVTQQPVKYPSLQVRAPHGSISSSRQRDHAWARHVAWVCSRPLPRRRGERYDWRIYPLTLSAKCDLHHTY